jgi:hypothetical protein
LLHASVINFAKIASRLPACPLYAAATTRRPNAV